MSKKYCYLFTEGNAKMRELLGGKGANLAEMTNIGLPVPQGFTITTEACTQYYEDGRQINGEIMAEIMEYIEKMEKITGKKFGDLENPLLVSVRSGARASSARLECLRRRIRRRHERPGQLRRHPGRLRGADVRQDRRSPDRRSSCCDRLPLSVLRVLEKALHVRETDLSDSAEDPSRCCYCCRTCGYWALARWPRRCLRGSGLGRRSFGVDDSGANRHAGGSGCL